MERRMWHQNDPGVIPNLLITGRGAPTGILVYEGNLLPEPFRNQMIHAEPGRNVVWAFPAKQVGAGYQASITNLVHSKGDLNYRPSDVSVAPDGSLIIADWFDPVDCCHRTVNDAGRIFRVAPPKHAYVVPDFDFKTPAGAAKALRNPNLSVRYKAWTALQAMHEKARPVLAKMAADQNPRFRARALWALAAIKGGAPKAIELALQDEDDNLRALALRIARRHGILIEPLVRRLVRDESALVRRECAVSLHRVATSEAAELWAQLALQHNGKDRWYLEALGIGEKGNETACFKAWLKKAADAWKAPAGRDLVWRSRAPEAAGLLVKLVLDPKVPESEHPRFMRALDFHSGKAKEDALATLLLNLDAPAEPKKADRPNIIFVLCDDLGAGDLGVLWQNARKGKQKFSTPNMDQFAKEGMILSRHYCPAPSCMASRTSLMTGRHSGHSARRNFQFDAEIPNGHTLGSVLKKAGYATAAIGKWGMAGGPHQLSVKPVRGDRSPKTNPSHPTLRGFDYFFGYTAHRDAHYHYPKLGNRPLYDGFIDQTDRLAKCYSTDLFTARAKKWIVDHQKTHPKQPFFTYLCYTAPHAGLRIPTSSHLTTKGNYPAGGGLDGGVQWLDDATHGQINTAKGAVDKGMHPEVARTVGDDGQPWPDHARRHATMVRRLDDALADLIQLLKDLKIDDRTLVVLTSDNGTLREAGLDKVGFYHPDYLDTFGRYDGIKLDLWEGGVRMPTIVRWPSMIKAGSESTAASQFHDWMATFCDLSGVPAPAVSDGVSMVPSLTSQGEQPLGIVYSEFISPGNTPNFVEFEAARRGRPRGQMQSVLIGEYKGIRVNIKNHQSVFEVYHTLKDPKETTNLAGKPGVPTQRQFQHAVLRSRRIDPLAKRPYDNALIPAVTGIANRPGLIRKEYPGQFDWVPQLGDRTPSSQKLVSGLKATPGAQQFIGYLRISKDGVYHFALTTNGKAVVRLHDTLLIDADSQYVAGSKAPSGKIMLQAGLHPLRISCLASDNAPALSLEWQVPDEEMKPMPTDRLFVE
jgi:arylsulfatase A-like enzyme